MCASKFHYGALLLAAAFFATAAPAADKKAELGKGELRRLQQAQRQLEKEKSQLAEQKAAAESELGEVRRKADGEARRVAALSRDAASLRAARDAALARLAETENELRQTQSAQRAAEAEGKRLQAALSAEQQQLGSCAQRNQELRKLGGEVLELYEKKSCLDSSLQREPFTGLKRVDIENIVEDMREKLDSQLPGS